MKRNRLISDFRNQTSSTIWKYLDMMSKNFAVYSTWMYGYRPSLPENDVYVYAYPGALVVVCLDCCGNGEEQTYMESDVVGPFIYRAGCEPRVSIVGRLAEAMKLMTARLQASGTDAEVYGVLLTEATILNADELEERWDAQNLMVIDGLKRLKYRTIMFNDDEELPGQAYVKVIRDDTLVAATSDDSMATPASSPELNRCNGLQEDIDEEFERMFTDFINREYEETMNGDKKADEHDDNGEEDNEAEEDTPDEVLAAGGPFDDILLPSGTIRHATLRPGAMRVSWPISWSASISSTPPVASSSSLQRRSVGAC